MKQTVKRLTAVLLALCLGIAAGCSAAEGDNELKVGVEGLSNAFNPFYTGREENAVAMAQLFERIQRQGNGNKLQNVCGSITYEHLDNGQVKYTVSLNEGVRFSDGTYATVDDIIFYYMFLSDACYDGPYNDWMENDIVGLKAFYYDDEDYEQALAEIEDKVEKNYTAESIEQSDLVTYLVATSLNGKYAEGDGKDWGAYCKKYGYEKEYDALGKDYGSDELLSLLARVEAESNPESYDPADWWRQSLTLRYVQKNYSDGVDVASVSGIAKVNDHCCTLLFDSVNVNTISLINPLIVPKSVYGAGYQKGACDVVRQTESVPVGSGPYAFDAYDEENSVLTLTSNAYYHGGEPTFNKLKITETAGGSFGGFENSDIDVYESVAADTSKDAYSGEGMQSFFSHDRCYYALTFNAARMSKNQRKAVMKVVNCSQEIKGALGESYTTLNYPLSLRFGEYPTDSAEAAYALDVSGAKALLLEEGFAIGTGQDGKAVVTNIKGKAVSYTVACCGDENSLPYTVCSSVKNSLAVLGIALTVTPCTPQAYEESLKSGSVDFWCGPVEDGLTCDCYPRYGTNGALNYARIGDLGLDAMLNAVRNTSDYEARCILTEQMLQSVMNVAVVLPLYQQKTVTVYNTKVIAESSLSFDSDPAGCRYLLHTLTPA